MEKNETVELLKTIAFAALEGGKKILEVYQSDFAVESKEDRSPLTLADKQAHGKISEELNKTSYPVLSEEGRSIPFQERREWDRFWMVDPLDGTKEFIKRNGEFTVNIALIERGKPIMGVIYVPVKDQMYLGAESFGAYRLDDFSDLELNEFESAVNSENRLPKSVRRNFTLVGSRSHMSEATVEYMESLKHEHDKIDILSVGSSLKLCMLAEGKADVYPRFAPTMEWDTAAGQAILEAAGGTLIDWESKEVMQYNRENLRNNWFLAKV